jgi:hypothetical protein
LEVGNSEKHHLEISAGPFSPIKLFVEGKEAQKTGNPIASAKG